MSHRRTATTPLHALRPRRILGALFVLALGLWAGPGGRAGAAEDDEKSKLEVNATPENARKVEFTTDEGTWMSVDVAPDGRSILFDLLGDLYRLPIEGGKARRLTSGPAWDYAPRTSPDGRAVVFCSDRSGNMNLWLMQADGGAPRPLTQETGAVFSSPSWTPDGLY
ncbi:MAG: TolB family protein, partial [bacterium]